MQQKLFGSTQRSVSVIGQGTWMLEDADRHAALANVRRGLDLGMSHIDTAEMYGNGAAEELVGEAIRGRRDEIFLVSKVLPSNASREGAVQACERSLARLKTDRLDCYLLHWRGRFRLEETIAGFEELKRSGKILSWGVSNFDVKHLEGALAISGDGQIACNQVLYHLGKRAIEHAVLPWCEAHDVALVAYSPFGQKDFPGPSSSGGPVLKEVGDSHGATSRQVALAHLTRRKSVFAIPKASRLEHVDDNAGASGLQLSEAEHDRVEAAFPRGPQPRSLPMI